MKDTPQVQNAAELLELYEELTILVSQLNADAPKIKKMYTSLEQTIAKQDNAVARSTQNIEATTNASIAQIQKEAKAAIDASAKHLAAAEAIARRCETAMSQMEAMVKKVQSVKDDQKLIENRLAQIEKQLRTEAMPYPTDSISAQSNRKTYQSREESANNASTLSDYFSGYGFKVIDRRSSGGALWIVGTEAELKHHVAYVKKHFDIADSCGYSTGRATGGKPGWWTQSKK